MVTDDTKVTAHFTITGKALTTTRSYNNSTLWTAKGVNQTIYLMGKAFKYLQMNTIATPINTLVYGNQTTYNTYFSGIQRPTVNYSITKINNTPSLYQSDKIAFFASTKNTASPEKNYIYSNYIKYETSFNNDLDFGVFILDWWEVASSITTMKIASIGKDSGTVYANDRNANFKISLSFLSTISLLYRKHPKLF